MTAALRVLNAERMRIAAVVLLVDLVAALSMVLNPSLPMGKTGFRLPFAIVLIGLAGVIALAAQIASQNFVWAAIALLPIVSVEPAPSDILFFAAVVGYLLREGLEFPGGPAMRGVALIAISTFTPIAFHAPDAYGIRFAFITIFMIAIVIASYNTIRTQEDLDKAVTILVWGGLISLAICVPIFLTHAGGQKIFHLITRYKVARLRGFFKDPNVFGPYCVFLALLSVSLVNRVRRRDRLVGRATFLLASLGMVLSASRAAIGIGAGALMLYLLLQRPARVRAFASIGFLTLAFVVLVRYTVISSHSLDALLHTRVQTHLQTYDTNRFSRQAQGWSAGLSHPEGLGPGWFNKDGQLGAHSLYVRVWAENGILGTVGLLLFLLFVTRSAIRVWRADPNGIGLALLVSWITLLPASAVIDTLHWRHLWVIAGLILAVERIRFSPPSLGEGEPSPAARPPLEPALVRR